MRPLKSVLKKEFEGQLANVGAGGQPFGTHRVRSSFEQFLERLFRNNEPPFFYYPANHGAGVPEELCAMLALPIAFKPEHYDKLLSAKVVGVTDVFQAKLGWLVGQLYSRVGTPDYEDRKLAEMVRSYTDGLALWLEEAEDKALRKMVEERKAANGGLGIGRQELSQMIGKIPKRKAAAIAAVLDVAIEQGLIPVEGLARRNFRIALENNGPFAAQFR